MALDKGSVVPEDHRMPRRNVKFPASDALTVTRQDVLDSATFLALDPKTANEAKPALISVEGGEAQKGFQLPDGRVAVVAGFDKTAFLSNGTIDASRATFPMSSPNGKHVYMDVDQATQAARHGGFRSALISAEGNAGYNKVVTPDVHPTLDPYFERSRAN
ncbi:MAG: hypothetical protein AAB383_03995 [Patescibacteria group bacterium]